MKQYNLEAIVGVFVLVGFAAIVYISVNLGDVSLFGAKGYQLVAEFDSVSGLNEGAPVEIGGVPVGRVERITLEDYNAAVRIRITSHIEIPDDSLASIRTKGIIGEKFIKITPGGSGEWLKQGEEITDTESSVDIEELISKYVFNMGSTK